jgi:hypothetical protein
MRSRHARMLTGLVALSVALGVVSPTLGAATPVAHLSLSGIVCDPGGHPGLRATAKATVANTTVRYAQLVIFEFQPISDPAFAPFTWTAMSVATWISEDSFKTGSAADSRTLDTTDRRTWNRGNYADGIWFESKSDSWWLVDYSVTLGSRAANQQNIGWYVSCPAGSVVDSAGLRTIEQVEMTGLR